jgi:hypothetical protein
MKRNGKENSKQLKNFKVSQPTIFKKYGNYLGVKECDESRFWALMALGWNLNPIKYTFLDLA